MSDLRILLKKYIEEGDDHFPALFRQIKPYLYFPLLKYRNFLPDTSPPDSDAVQRDGFSDLFAALCQRNAVYKYEATKDMVYEIWVALENENILIKYYHEGRDSNGIKKGLRKIAGQRMLSRIIKKEPELSRIYKRMIIILKHEEEFNDFSLDRESWWGLSVWLNPEEFHGSLEDIKNLLSSISVIKRIKERRGAKKASAIISNPGLKDLMARILEEIRKTLTAAFFIKSIGLKVYITDPGFVSLDAPIKSNRAESNNEEERDGYSCLPSKTASTISAKDSAAEFLNSLTGRQRQVLKLCLLEGVTLTEAGRTMGISKSLVGNERTAILEILRKIKWKNLEEYELFTTAVGKMAMEKIRD
ncbi:MAG: sigma factor-like helix-turn-helix DNA-binding protein [Candidatus Auribacterota bacterium]|nr:sigma factor-like helix-turn-helix DNA-binding protein [Candidatus Auribacterota bacterium]